MPPPQTYYVTPSFDGPDYWVATSVRGQQVFNPIATGTNPKVNQALYLVFDWRATPGIPNNFSVGNNTSLRIKKLTDDFGILIVPEPNYPTDYSTATNAIPVFNQGGSAGKRAMCSLTPNSPGQYKIEFTIAKDVSLKYLQVNYDSYYLRRTTVEYTYTVDP